MDAQIVQLGSCVATILRSVIKHFEICETIELFVAFIAPVLSVHVISYGFSGSA